MTELSKLWHRCEHCQRRLAVLSGLIRHPDKRVNEVLGPLAIGCPRCRWYMPIQSYLRKAPVPPAGFRDATSDYLASLPAEVQEILPRGSKMDQNRVDHQKH